MTMALWNISRDSDAVQHLSQADPQLDKLIRRVGHYCLQLRTDYYGALVRSIIGQQLSVTVAETIWERLSAAVAGSVSPEAVAGLAEEELRCIGLSRPKIQYLRHLTQAVDQGHIDLTLLAKLEDEEIISLLTAVKGVGRWTAQIFLIFSLARPDVLATADLGLQRATQWLYKLDTVPTEKELGCLGERWRPYRTVASLYLWEIINRGWLKRG